MIVVKVGGSLFDHPALGPGLRDFVHSLMPADVVLVPGGGAVADAVRELDRVHGLGEEAAHWLALRALSVTAGFLRRVVEEPNPRPSGPTPPAPLPAGRGEKSIEKPDSLFDSKRPSSSPPPAGRGAGGVGPVSILDPFAFALEDESRTGPLPHSWAVTTDSIAARVALVFRAERLILLKSVDVPPRTPWLEAAANGWVDEHFPSLAAALTCPVEIVAFRRQLDARA